MAKSTTLYGYLISIFSHITETHWQTVVMGISWVATLLTCKEIAKRYKKWKFLKAIGPLMVTFVGTLITFLARLDLPGNAGIAIVGDVPMGLPVPTGNVRLSEIGTLATSAVMISVIGFVESFAIAESLSQVRSRKKKKWVKKMVGESGKRLGLGLGFVELGFVELGFVELGLGFVELGLGELDLVFYLSSHGRPLHQRMQRQRHG